MLIVLILTPIFFLVFQLIDFMPNAVSLPNWINDAVQVLGYAMQLFPNDVWVVVILNVVLWNFGLIGWAIFEWLYKKIPGVS